MKAALVKISQTNIVSGDTNKIITGINDEFEIYFMQLSNIKPVTNNVNLTFRVTQGGVSDTTAIYDLSRNDAFDNSSTITDTGVINGTGFTIANGITTDTAHPFNCSIYLFNFPTNGEYSLATFFSTYIDANGRTRSMIGGGEYKGNTVDDGVDFFLNSGNFDSGQINLYGLLK